MKNLRVPFWVWVLVAIFILTPFRTCGLFDRILGISGCVKSIPSGGGLILSQDGQTLVVTSGYNAQLRNPQNGSLI